MRNILARWMALLFGAVSVACGQQHVMTPRADHAQVPLLVYAAQGAQGCAPLAVISHGAGGSEYGYAYLAIALAQMGYTTVVMGHRESGAEALRADIRVSGLPRGVVQLVTNPVAEGDRLADITATLAWADAQCKAPFRVLLGHSMGAETVMLEAGARSLVKLDAGLAGQSRFDAYVALSPEGTGIVFPEHAWRDIHKPMLVMTGTLDQSLKGGPAARLMAWNDLQGMATHCQWQGVIDGATHFNFAGDGPGHERVEPMVTKTVAAFLGGVRGGACTLPAVTRGLQVQAK